MVKCILTVALLVLFACPSTYAVMASPEPIDVQQPDGSSIRVRIQGDELQNWTESEETGHTILRNTTSGYWEYSERAKDGTLRPNGMRVLPSGRNAPAGLPQGLRPPRNRDNERHMQHMLKEQSTSQVEASSSASQAVAVTDGVAAAAIWNPTPVSGTKKMLVIMVSFADRPFQTSPASWYSKIFDESDKSVTRFYKDNSFGLMRVTPVSHSQADNPAGIVSVTLPTKHPNTGGDYTFASDQAWGNSALALASAYVDFNSLDTNGNGKLETSEVVIYFVVAGYEASGSSKTPSVWAHAWSTSGTGLTAGSKNIQRWSQNGELNNSSVQHPMGVIAHELGHQMCGLPDLYDISQFNAGLGNFSIMAGGSWGRDYNESYGGTTPTSLDAWSREFLGWLTPVVPDMSNPISPFSFGYQLSSTYSPYKLILPSISTSEYFLIENRWPTGWDLGLRGMPYFGSGWKGGLLVLHIDNNAGSSINDYTNNVANRQGVVPVQASTTSCNMLESGSSGSCRGNSKTLFYSGNDSNNWTSSSVPNSNYYNGALSNIYLTAISLPNSTMTAEFSSGSPVTPGAPNLGLAIRGNGQASVSFSTPAYDGGSTITGYEVTSSPGDKTVSGTFSPLTLAGLINGTAYTFTVTAANSIGSGPPSAASNSITPATVPGAPAIGTVSVGSGQATISFSAPASDGGSLITSYTVSTNGGQTTSVTMSPVTLTGLANGTTYSFSARATNSAGTGAASGLSASTKPGSLRNSGSSTIGYLTLQSAYNANTPEIQIVAETLVGPFVKTDSDTVTIKGGYDVTFTDGSGLPSVLGAVVLKNGTTRLQNVVIRP